MLWYHYALLFYWAVSGFWLHLELSVLRKRRGILASLSAGYLMGWLALPAVLIGRALR
jgi:hypothetical protein